MRSGSPRGQERRVLPTPGTDSPARRQESAPSREMQERGRGHARRLRLVRGERLARPTRHTRLASGGRLPEGLKPQQSLPTPGWLTATSGLVPIEPVTVDCHELTRRACGLSEGRSAGGAGERRGRDAQLSVVMARGG